MHTGNAAAHFFAGRYAEALSSAETAVRQQPNYALAISIAAASGALAGRLSEAKKAAARLRELDPTLRIPDLMDLIPFRQPVLARWAEGLRKAGLPE